MLPYTKPLLGHYFEHLVHILLYNCCFLMFITLNVCDMQDSLYSNLIVTFRLYVKFDGWYKISVGGTHRRVGWVRMDSMGNSKRPWMILNMEIRSPQIRPWVRENGRTCMKAASIGHAEALSQTSE